MATKTVVTRSTVADDEKRLRSVLTTFLDVPNFDTHQTEYGAHEIVLALKEQGITLFNRDFLSLSEADIRDLTYTVGTTTTTLSLIESTSDASPSYLPFTTTPVLLLKDKLNSRTYPALNSTNFARTNMIQTRRSVLGNPYLRNPPIHLARPNSVFGRKAFAPTRPNTRNFAMNPSGHARKNSSTRPLNRTISVTSLIPSTSSPMPILIKPSEDGCTVLCKQHSKLPWRKPSLPNILPTKTHVLSGKNFASTTIPP